MVEGLPDAARRYLLHAIQPGTPLASQVRLTMQGTIKAGRWLRFRAREQLDPHAGFSWRARLLRGLLHVRDSYQAERGASALSALGVLPLSTRRGADIDASAFGRLVCEAMWTPAALLPARGVAWDCPLEDVAVARWSLGDREAELSLRVDERGRVLEAWASRWGDPAGEGWGWVPCGGVFEAERSFGGYVIPSKVRAGWWFGTERFNDGGEFFRATVTRARFQS